MELPIDGTLMPRLGGHSGEGLEGNRMRWEGCAYLILGFVTKIYRVVIAKVSRLDMTMVRGQEFDIKGGILSQMSFLKEVLPISFSY